MNQFKDTMDKYPIGTVLRLLGDYIEESHEVCGYEWYSDTVYLLFRDGRKLNMDREVLIEEVIQDADVA